MNSIEMFPGLVGFYTLTPEGKLGHCDQNKKFILDAKLTKAFTNYTSRYLMAYLQNPAQGAFRLAIIYRAQEKRPWGTDTLLMEKHIVRRLYPVIGMTTEKDLTVFQKNNQEKSIFRGMELFLEYKDTANPGMPVFCPMLYDRGAMLSEYGSMLDRPLTAADRETPVVEVINFLAAIPMGRRDTPEIKILEDKVYQNIIRKDMRKPSDFTLIDDVRPNAAHHADGLNAGKHYDGADKRTERKVTLEIAGERSTFAGNVSDMDALIRNTVASPSGPDDAVDPMVLRVFTRFHDLAHDKLVAIAAQTIISREPPGTQLLEHGTTDSFNLYLLDGKVQLVAVDGGEKIVESGTAAARNAISSLKPRMYSVSAFTHVTYLWIDDKVVDEIVRGNPTAPLRRDGA